MLPLDPPLRRKPLADGATDRGPWGHWSGWAPEGAELQVDYARGVLDQQPGNLFAMRILAHHAESNLEHAAIIREAVRVGQKLWAPELSGAADAPEWGTCPEAAPFLACVLTYARLLMAEGNQEEASQCLGFLLKLDPDDRIGAVAEMEDVGLVQKAEPGRRMA